MVQEPEATPSHPSKLVVVLKSPRTEDRSHGAAGDPKTETKVLLQGADCLPAEPSDEPVAKQEEPSLAGNRSEDRDRDRDRDRSFRPGNWVHAEIITLLEAKRKEQDLFPASRRSSSSDEKWKFVADYCRSKCVLRTKEQCRIKWDNMQPDYRKIKEYEEQRDEGAPSYFEMEIWERRQKGLPSNMDVEVYRRILSIHSNKPGKGGLKREAREKKIMDTPSSSGVLAIRNCTNGAVEGSNGGDCDGDKTHPEGSVPFNDYTGKYSLPGPNRSRKRRAVLVQSSSSPDDSSTEDDTTVISSRFQAASAVPTYVYGEKHTPPIHKGFEARDLSRVVYQSPQNGRQFVEGSNGDGAGFNARRESAAAASHEPIADAKDYEMTSYIEDRKDARHKEFLALEREKLAVFREASFTIANAMTNAMSVFSKIAEELLMKRR